MLKAYIWSQPASDLWYLEVFDEILILAMEDTTKM